MRTPVEMKLLADRRTYEAPTLGANLGWLCPFSFAAQVPDPDEGSVASATYLHECLHYHQLVSTPFGFHLALTDWLASLGLSSMLIGLHRERHPFVEIPLLWAVANGRLPEIYTEAVAEAVAATQYCDWLLGSGMEVDDFLRYSVDVFSRAPVILCSRMGSEDAHRLLATSVPPALPESDEGRTIKDTIVTTNDILENTATVGTDAFASGAWFSTVQDFLAAAKANKPPNYCHLLEDVAEVFGDHLYKRDPHSYVSNVEVLSVIFTVISDLSLCGSCLPETTSNGSQPSSWEDIHPAWRFTRIRRALAENRSLRREFYTAVASRDELKQFVDELAASLGWSRPSQIHSQVNWEMLGVLGVPFTWAVHAFREGIGTREEQSLLPPVAGYLQSLDRFMDSDFDPAMDARQYATAIKGRIGELMGRLAPPFALLKDRSGYFSVGDKEASFAINLYYLSYFTKCMLYADNLNYSVALVDPADVRRVFTGMFQYAPDDFYASDLPS